MKKTTIYLPDQMALQIKAASVREKRTEAEIIRMALGDYFEKQQRALPSFVGMVCDPDFQARDTDAYLDKHWKPDW
jgi:hypothetical protein